MSNSLYNIFKKKFLAGLIIIIPVFITIFVIVTFFKFIDGILSPILKLFIKEEIIPGVGFLLAFIIIFLVGLLSTNIFGRKTVNLIEKIFLNIPVFKNIYTAIKQLLNAFSPENAGSFKKFVIVEYPRKEVYAFGFLTKECIVSAREHSVLLKTVYVPTNNLYLGEVILINDKDIIYTDISIEDGIKIMLSGGIASPPEIIESKKDIR